MPYEVPEWLGPEVTATNAITIHFISIHPYASGSSNVFFMIQWLPTMQIGLVAVLDSPQLVIKFLTDRACFPVFDIRSFSIFTQIVDPQDGTDHGCCSAGTCFFKGGELFLATMRVQLSTPYLRQLHQTLFVMEGKMEVDLV